MPLKSGGALDNEKMRGRTNSGLISIGKGLPDNLYGSSVWAGGGDVVKVSLKTFTRTTSLSPSNVPSAPLASNGTFLYVGSRTTPAVIAKISLATFTEEATLTLTPADSGGAWDMVIKDGFLYVSVDGPSPGRILKIDLSTFTQVASLDFNTGENTASGLKVVGNYLYVSCSGGSTSVVKVDLSTFTRVASATITNTWGLALATSGNFLYVGHWLSPAKITKIDLASFTETAILTLAAGEDDIRSADALLIDGNNLYVALGTYTGKIAKIDLATFTKTATLNITNGDTTLSLEKVGTFLYAGFWADVAVGNGYIVKIDLATFTLTTELNLLTVEQRIFYLLAV